MIASVVATLEDVGGSLQDILTEMASVPGAEVGDVLPSSRRVPVTIDSSAPDALEAATSQLQQCRGVAFVDVVFVHFEDESERVAASYRGKMNYS